MRCVQLTFKRVIHLLLRVTANQETIVELISFAKRIMSQFELNQRYSQIGKYKLTCVVLDREWGGRRRGNAGIII